MTYGDSKHKIYAKGGASPKQWSGAVHEGYGARVSGEGVSPAGGSKHYSDKYGNEPKKLPRSETTTAMDVYETAPRVLAPRMHTSRDPMKRLKSIMKHEAKKMPKHRKSKHNVSGMRADGKHKKWTSIKGHGKLEMAGQLLQLLPTLLQATGLSGNGLKPHKYHGLTGHHLTGKLLKHLAKGYLSDAEGKGITVQGVPMEASKKFSRAFKKYHGGASGWDQFTKGFKKGFTGTLGVAKQIPVLGDLLGSFGLGKHSAHKGHGGFEDFLRGAKKGFTGTAAIAKQLAPLAGKKGQAVSDVLGALGLGAHHGSGGFDDFLRGAKKGFTGTAAIAKQLAPLAGKKGQAVSDVLGALGLGTHHGGAVRKGSQAAKEKMAAVRAMRHVRGHTLRQSRTSRSAMHGRGFLDNLKSGLNTASSLANSPIGQALIASDPRLQKANTGLQVANLLSGGRRRHTYRS